MKKRKSGADTGGKPAPGATKAPEAEARKKRRRGDATTPGPGKGGMGPERSDSAGTIIELDDYRQRLWEKNGPYRSALRGILDRLSEASSDIQEACFMMAVAGPWRDWEATVPVGTQIAIDDEMLLDSGDEQITALILFKQRIDDFLASWSMD